MYHIGCDKSCYDSEANTMKYKNVKLTFNREQILYDIKNVAYIEGHKLDEKQQHIQHTIVDICEEGNIDRVNRILYNVYLSVVEMLYPYTKNEIMDNMLNNDSVKFVTQDSYDSGNITMKYSLDRVFTGVNII